MPNTFRKTLSLLAFSRKDNIMMKKLFPFAILISLSFNSFAQERPTLGPRPNLPGDFFVHVGKNVLFGQPSAMDVKLWGSTSTQLGYMYPAKIGNSNFTFNGGLALSFENFSFRNGKTLTYFEDDSVGNTLTVATANSDSAYGFMPVVRNSRFATTYLDIPIEFRWYANPAKRGSGGFYVALGGYVGYRLGARNVINYTDPDGEKGVVFKEEWQLNQFRAGASFRVGVAGFGAFARYQLTPLFQADQAPFFRESNGASRYTGAPFTFGLTIDIF